MGKEKIIIIADRAVEYCLYGLILSIPISSTAIEIFAGLAILGFVVKKGFSFRDSPLRGQSLSRTHLFLLLFIIFNGLSLFNSGPYLRRSAEALFFKWLEYILIFLIVEDTLINRRRLRNALAILLIVAGVVGIDGVFQRLWGWDFLRGRQIIRIKEGMQALSGPFKHYNDFAAYLVCVLPLGIALLFKGQSLTGKILYRAGLFFLIGLLGLSLLFTFSRGGWLGFLAAGLFMLFLTRKWKVIMPIICIFILVLILVPVARERFLFTFKSGGDAGRLVIWQGAWAMIKENPFLGKGVGTFMVRFPHYTRGLGIQYAHNCYLQMWAGIGVFGLLSFLLFVGSVLYRGVKVFRDSSFPSTSLGTSFGHRGQSLVLLGLICGIFGFLVHSFFDTQLYSLQLSVLFWVMLGLVMGMQKVLGEGAVD